MMTTTAPDTRPIRHGLPMGLLRDLQGLSAPYPSQPAEPPSSIKAAIVRWLNEEL